MQGRGAVSLKQALQVGFAEVRTCLEDLDSSKVGLTLNTLEVSSSSATELPGPASELRRARRC